MPHMFKHSVSSQGVICEGFGTIRGEVLWLSRTLEVGVGGLETSPGSSLTHPGATLMFLPYHGGRHL